MTIDLKDIPTAEAQDWLQHAVAPRPIGLVSTVDGQGRANLSPFSFFNLFSANPPIVIFSPARRVRDNTEKHTLENIREVPEAVIHICDHSMAHQISLASNEYPKGVDEFGKAGFGKQKADRVRPPMAKQAHIKLECAVMDIIPLGQEGGAGNLVICGVLKMHIDDAVLTNGRIDPQKMTHIARLGGDWYCKVDSASLFKLKKPGRPLAIGVDALPENIRSGGQFTPGELAQLASVPELPEMLAPEIGTIQFRRARRLLGLGLLEEAWQVLSTPQTVQP